MKKTILITLCSLCLYLAEAQVPGYMGLRLSLQYQGSISPQWTDFDHSLMPYLSHNVQVGYVISREYEVGLQYTHIGHSSNYSTIYEDYQDVPDRIVIDQKSFTGNNVTAYMKFFRYQKGFIAPLGRYFIVGLTYQNSMNKFHVAEDNTSPIGAPNYTTVKSNDLALAAGVGRNIIVFDRMLISIEGDISIPISSAARAGKYNPNGFLGSGYNAVVQYPNTYKYINGLDVMFMNMLQIKVGIGLLAF